MGNNVVSKMIMLCLYIKGIIIDWVFSVYLFKFRGYFKSEKMKIVLLYLKIIVRIFILKFVILLVI